MGPREGDCSTKMSMHVSTPRGDGWSFWTKLTSIPILQSTKDFYIASKGKSKILGAGLSVLEIGVTIAATPVTIAISLITNHMPDTVTEKVSCLDNVACDCLSKMEESYPVLTASTNKVVEDVKSGTKSTMQSTVRIILKTLPGRLALRSLEAGLQVSEVLLNMLDTDQEQKKPTARSKEQLSSRPTRSKSRKKVINLSGPITIYNFIIIMPAKILVSVLRDVKRGVVSVAGLHPKRCSPKKKVDVQRRRKLTPHKRTKRGLISSTVHYVASKLGVAKSPQLSMEGPDIHLYLKPDSAGDDDDTQKCAKRKYEELDRSDSDTDDSEVYLNNLSDYVSDEDPDYMPSDGVNDSLEFEEGDTESDIEVEGSSIKVDRNLEAVLIEHGKPAGGLAVVVTKRKMPVKDKVSEDAMGKDSAPEAAKDESKHAKAEDISECFYVVPCDQQETSKDPKHH